MFFCQILAPAQARVYTPEALDWQKKAAQTQSRWQPASPAPFAKTTEVTTAVKHVQSPSQEYVAAYNDPNPTGPPMDPPPSSDHPLDPHFAAKIAEAERPHVPSPQQPPWVSAAAQKQQKWQQQYGETAETTQNHRVETQWNLGSGKNAGDKWQRHYGTLEFENGISVPEAHKRSHSQEPRKVTTVTTTTTTKQVGKEPWMKPYVAPNIDDLKKQRGQQTTTVTTSTTKYGGVPGGNPLPFGTQYGSKTHTNHTSTYSSQSGVQNQSVPFTPLTSEQTRALWQHETDAWSQRSRMEEEIHKRQANMPATAVSPAQPPTGGVWRPGGAVTSTSVT